MKNTQKLSLTYFKGFIILVFVGAFFSTNAQESLSRLKYGFEVMYTPSYNFLNQTNAANIDENVFQTIVSEENGRMVHPVVLNFTFDPISKLRLKLGIGFQQLAYKSPIYKSELENNVIQEVRFNVSSRYFQVPLSVQYFFVKSFYFEAAYVPLFLVNTEHTTYTKTADFSNEGIFISRNGYEPYNQLIEFSIGYQARLGESSISINLAPKISYSPSFAEVSSAQIRRSHWQLGLSLGIHSFL